MNDPPALDAITRRLAASVEQSYRTFARYRPGKALNVCSCSVCLDEKDEATLLATPLRSISAELLGKFTDAVSAGTVPDRANDMRYFLPRYFELIAANDPPDDMGLAICLRRLRDFDWRKGWSASEVETIDAFFDAYMAACVEDTTMWPAPSLSLRRDLRAVLTIIVTAGGDILRVLDVWDRAGGPAAVIHMAALRNDVVRDPIRLADAHLSREFDAEAEHIGAFLARPEVDCRIEAAFFATDDPRLQKLLSDADWRLW